ncbi:MULTISPECIES: endonuclease III domain-containing protein [unclassified Caulobacter]|uniref:endonuclease III domain-containing protein n=1 Tax=unclassified Caulobacter TaxID=2648921 RepID=UPI000D3B7631|nr:MULTISPECIES: endonuclease III [unclassified Caulobacter]PTS88700.1 endonuclease III [Caulobacter sp. HMWF009]PTT05166.1 endonuclease III [Caulobacter sp. HMWF025]
MQLSLGLSRSPLEGIRDRLLAEFGPQRPVARMDPVSQLVKSSISTRTEDAVSWAAFLRLRAAFKCWEDLARAEEALVLDGLGDVAGACDKARRLPLALRMIEARIGWLSLSHLRNLSVDAARHELQSLPGVGTKVSASVLNFSSLAIRALVVDSHVHRTALRLGLTDAADATGAYHALMALVPEHWTADDLFELHWLMKRGLGQMLCLEDTPQCGACTLKQACPKTGVGRKADILAWRQRDARVEKVTVPIP